MRRPLGSLLVSLALVLIAGGCSNEQVSKPRTTTTTPISITTDVPAATEAPTTITAPTTTTVATPTTSYAVDWANPLVDQPDPVPGSSGAFGSGCTPGSDRLPDGIWAGWIINRGPSSFEFDLACLWPTPEEPYLTNDSARLRTVAADVTTVVYPVTTDGLAGPATPYADAQPSMWCTPGSISPSLPDGCPVWVYVNGGVATEILEFWLP